MIKYALACDKGHEFESWFADSAAFDKQAKRKLVSCPVCGSTPLTAPTISEAKMMLSTGMTLVISNIPASW